MNDSLINFNLQTNYNVILLEDSLKYFSLKLNELGVSHKENT